MIYPSSLAQKSATRNSPNTGESAGGVATVATNTVALGWGGRIRTFDRLIQNQVNAKRLVSPTSSNRGGGQAT